MSFSHSIPESACQSVAMLILWSDFVPIALAPRPVTQEKTFDVDRCWMFSDVTNSVVGLIGESDILEAATRPGSQHKCGHDVRTLTKPGCRILIV